jgi:hypothetical protein
LKRVRLFEAATPNANAKNESPLPSAQSLKLPNKQVQQDSVAVTVAKSEQDMALAERDKPLQREMLLLWKGTLHIQRLTVQKWNATRPWLKEIMP